MTRGRVFRVARYWRANARAHPKWLFVFGDNLARSGFGGQARELRGEPNAIGIPTKHRPAMDDAAFFTDGIFDDPDVMRVINDELGKLDRALAAGQNVVLPRDGVGTGLSQLPQRAPRSHAYLERRLRELG